jgi:diaminopimelate decarboxylase
MEVNVGGGMAVSYADPESRFDWEAYGAGLAALRRSGETLRIEPGRSISVYCGRYVTWVMDVKRVHGELFAVVAGGTHHIRTPATKGHSQPMVMDEPGEPATIVGQLCIPKDTMARHVPVSLKTGDVVEFLMAPRRSLWCHPPGRTARSWGRRSGRSRLRHPVENSPPRPVARE